MEYISFDTHKFYTLVEREDAHSRRTRHCRLEHAPGAVRQYLRGVRPGTAVAVEATGNWYWVVEEIEQAGLVPKLVHPRKAKLMMGLINKTDKLDVHGLNVLQRNGTLPTVWIPPGELRDLRELTRTRQVMVQQCTRLKNRIQSTLNKYGLLMGEFSDPYGKKARSRLQELVKQLPEQTVYVTSLLLEQLDFVSTQLVEQDTRLKKLVKMTPEMELLMSIPGIGFILAAVIALEVGDIARFPSAQHLASYSGTTPRVHSSGDKTRYGRLRPDVDRYLKWAFVEAANSICLNHRRSPCRHVSQLYKRVRDRKGHPKAIGAVARHLAEASFHVLSRKEAYRDPVLAKGQSKAV